MFPILFRVPGTGFPVTTFGLMVVLGFLLGAHVFTKVGLRFERDPETARQKLDSVPIWILIGVILGARLMYVTVEVLQDTERGQAFVADPLSVLFVHQGGLVMYGGAFGAMLMGWLGTRRHGLSFPHALDLGMICGFLGLCIGRIGCLLVGDDYGAVVPENWQHLPFPFTIRVPEELRDGSLFGQENAGKTLWATQIWMSANGLLLAFIGMKLLARRRYFGQVALQLLLLYSIGRFTIEAFRGDSMRGLWFDGAISTSQLISIAVALTSIVLLVRFRGRSDEGAPLPPKDAPTAA